MYVPPFYICALENFKVLGPGCRNRNGGSREVKSEWRGDPCVALRPGQGGNSESYITGK